VRLTIVGTGYVGLVSGTCFADFGHDVICVDADREKIDMLKNGVMPIYEPGLKELVASNVEQGRLSFSTDLAASVTGAQAIFIAVGTPPRPDDGAADLSYVYAAAQEIAAHAPEGAVIVTKSTVPVGTSDEIERITREVRPGVRIHVACNPEFLREGAAIEDFKKPDRIVIGSDFEEARKAMEEIYRPLEAPGLPVLYMDRRSAELTKYAANAFLTVKITFINEIADLCEATGANVQFVAAGIGLDNRIGAKFLQAGPGYGGPCFPKDTQALVKTGNDAGTPLRIIETVVAINNQRKRAMAQKIIVACGGDVRGKTVAVLGLTFKPNTDEMRDAPSLSIVPALQDKGAHIRAYDPEGTERARQVLSKIDYATSAYDAIEGADAMVLVTEWDAFRALDFGRVRTLMRTPVIVDLRNIYSPDEMKKLGFSYTGIGR
jgi:UDPglucose 6-dehydrogenase